MAINTTVEPFVQRMLQQPDPRIGAELVSGTVNNFMGAYLARKDVERDEEEKASNDPTYQKQSGFQRFSRGFLGAPGMIEEGRQPFSVQRRAAAERETTLNRQIDSLLKDPKALADEIGNLTPDQIPDWIQKNAGLAANPIGKSMLDAAGRAYSSTKQAQIQAGRARHLGELAELFPNIDVTTPEGLAQAQKNLSVKELYNRARIEGRSLTQLPDDWFNPDGTINEQKAVPGMGQLPRSQRLRDPNLPLSPIGKLQFDLNQAEAIGDIEAAQAIRDEIQFRKEKEAGVDPVVERKFKLYEEAIRSGDKLKMKVYENDLKLNAMSPENKAMYEAEVQALDRDLKMATKPEEYLNRRMAIVRKYFGTQSTPSVGAQPGTSPQNPIRFDWKNGRLMRVP